MHRVGMEMPSCDGVGGMGEVGDSRTKERGRDDVVVLVGKLEGITLTLISPPEAFRYNPNPGVCPS